MPLHLRQETAQLYQPISRMHACSVASCPKSKPSTAHLLLDAPDITKLQFGPSREGYDCQAAIIYLEQVQYVARSVGTTRCAITTTLMLQETLPL